MKTSNFIIILLAFFLPATSQAQVNFTVNIPPSIAPGTNFTATFTLNAGGNDNYVLGNFLCANCTGTPTPTSGTINAPGGTLLVTFTAGPSGSVQVSGQATGGHGINECPVANPCTATSDLISLPVELATFTVATNDNKLVLLNWRTVSELNNAGFNVQRSTNTETWEDIGFVVGHGTTSEPQEYNLTDNKPAMGVSYYRLKQNDTNGYYQFSPVRTATIKGNQILVYPTITTGSITVLLPENSEEETSVSLYNQQGALVFKVLQEGNDSLTITLPQMIPGLYIVDVTNGKYHEVKKVFKQ